MKYIRTKDGVYSEIKYKVAKAFVSTFEEEQAKIMPTQKTNFNIIKQADTIEELCDRFVLITNRAHYGFGHLGNIERVVLGKEEKFIVCYGAIWTDKGLIYVAKMNEKGELELV